MDSSRRVLVIGGASDTETVLKAVLGPRGTTVERSRFLQAAPRNDSDQSAEVVVIDMDADPEAAVASSHSVRSNRVLIGSNHPDVIDSQERFLSKPFQYPELVKMIEDLLDARPAA